MQRQLSSALRTSLRPRSYLRLATGRRLQSAMSVSVTEAARRQPLPEDVDALKHHVGKSFTNPWESHIDMNAGQIISALLWRRLSGRTNDPDTKAPTVTVRKPEFLQTRDTPTLRATWLGHACYYIEFPGGLRVLFDPVFTPRCSPVQFMGPKRYTDAPCSVDDLPFVDLVVISHNHYDHLSHPTILKLKEKYPNVHFFAPIGVKRWFEQQNITNVTELDWWNSSSVTVQLSSATSPIEATLECLPCQHMSARTPFDRAETLWGSWLVESGSKKVYFGGDTGYRSVPELPQEEDDYSEKYSHLPTCPAFKEIGRHRGPFDLGLIPIGAYAPRFIMSPMHANPYDSVNIFIDTKCKRAMGIHWGTWVLTEEDVLEPPRLLKKAMAWKGLPETGVFDVCEIGESRTFE